MQTEDKNKLAIVMSLPDSLEFAAGEQAKILKLPNPSNDILVFKVTNSLCR